MVTAKTPNLLPKITFGEGKAELYLVDTLNELQRPKVTAKCMKMISGYRGWCGRMREVRRLNVLSLKELAHIVRLNKTEHARYCVELNASIDEELAAWTPVLTDEGYVKAELEARALKLAMNISTACLKQLAQELSAKIVDQDRLERRVRHYRSQVSVDTARLGLPVASEVLLLQDIIQYHRP